MQTIPVVLVGAALKSILHTRRDTTTQLPSSSWQNCSSDKAYYSALQEIKEILPKMYEVIYFAEDVQNDKVSNDNDNAC
jgi:hypothetical protein